MENSPASSQHRSSPKQVHIVSREKPGEVFNAASRLLDSKKKVIRVLFIMVKRNSTSIRFEPVKAKFLRITLTKSESIVQGEFRGKPVDFEVTWNMREMKVYGFM